MKINKKKPFLIENISKISEILKKKTKGKKIISSLLFTIFSCLFTMKETGNSKKQRNLAYKSLKIFPGFAIKLLRRFALKEFLNEYKIWETKSDTYKSKHKVKARIDGTKSGKKYGKMIPELERLWDYVNQCYIKTHEIYLFLVSIGHKDYIVDFLLVKKEKRDGWNKTAKRMINRQLKSLGYLKKSFLHYCRLSLDGAWGNGDMLKYLKEKAFKYVSIKSGGKDIVVYEGVEYTLKGLEFYLRTNGKYFPFNEVHNLKGEYTRVIVKLKKSDIEVRVILRRFKAEKGKEEYRYLMLLSPNTNIGEVYDYQICQCYQGRWGIEDCIKECKEIVDLTNYSFHSETTDNIEMFLSLRFICFMVLNWYQVEYCRPSKTSMWKVGKRFEEYFSKIGYKSIWNLFSG